jgi:hypothetical protein
MESLNIIEIACSRKYEDFYQEIGKSFAKGSFGHCFKVQIKNDDNNNNLYCVKKLFLKQMKMMKIIKKK